MKSAGEQAADDLSDDARAIQVAHVIRQLVDELKLQRELHRIASEGLRNALAERDALLERIARMEREG